MGIFNAVSRGLAYVICCLRPDHPSQDVYSPPFPQYESTQTQQPPPRHVSTLQPRPTAPLVLQPPCRHEGRPTVPSVSQPSRRHEDRPERHPQQRQEHRHEHPRHPRNTSRGRIDLNQVNQANPHYAGLRARANVEHDARVKSMQASREASQSGNSALGKALLSTAKRHKAEMRRLNKEAAEWIFAMNNANRKPGEVDMHGLHVQEAIMYTKLAVKEAKARGDSTLRIIVGKGLHSEGGAAKIKPAIQALMQKQQLAANIDPHNSGVIIVSLPGRDRSMGNVLRPVNLGHSS